MNQIAEISAGAQDAADIPSATIFEAIASTARDVRVIGKSDRNKFDGYDFASIDKFLMLVNPIASKNGLFPIISQRYVEFYENVNAKGGKSVWARFFFDVTLYHSSGQTLGPVNMMVCVPMNGAQTSGSAQSYALKQFLRSTLMIPTGDKDDADLSATEPHTQRPAGPSQDAIGIASGALRNASSINQLRAIWGDLPKPVQSVPSVIAAKDERKTELDAETTPAETPADDLGGDEIPYGGPSA
jgi:hypothetical protein